MHFERNSDPPDLQAELKKLISEKLCGRPLDENYARESFGGKFPDFACFRDIVLIEMKHLETEQHERLNQIFFTKIDSAEMPEFFGRRAAHHIIDAVSNGPAIKREIIKKLSSTIKNLLSKANKQFGDYRSRNPRKNSVNICVILNSRIQEFSPDVVAHAIHR